MWDHPPRVLIVDDTVMEAIRSALQDNGWKMDCFVDVASATAAIEKARQDGWEYDVAVLDFYLPRSAANLQADFDNSLCNLVRHCTMVWHISAHFDEKEVTKHIEQCHSSDQQSRNVEKGDGFIKELERQIIQALAASRIKASLNALQNSPSDTAYSRRFRADPALSSTSAINIQVCDDIKRYWKDLTPAFQNELRDSFDIETDPDGNVKSVYSK